MAYKVNHLRFRFQKLKIRQNQEGLSQSFDFKERLQKVFPL
jgi:hypothetical protein